MASIINMPRLSPTMEEGVLAKWTKKEGDKISPGDIIAEVETDKANMEFPLEDEGVLLKFLVKEGETVKLGAPVAILGEPGEDPAEAMKSLGQAAPQASAPQASAPAAKAAPSAATASPAPKTAPTPAAAPQGDGRIKVSPLARKIADELGVDLHGVTGSGPGGRIIERDVRAAQSSPKAAPSSATATRSAPPPIPVNVSKEDELVVPSQMRKTIARRLVEAKRDVPHIYLTAEATVDTLFNMREQLKELEQKVSVNDLVVKALALALRRVPQANVSWTAEGILHHGAVDVGVAVSIPDGLMTPVIRGADQKSLAEISHEIRELAERAKHKKLKPEEYSGGSATVTNLGMYGVRNFEAIINPPESVILAVGATEKRPIVENDQLKIAQRMTLTLSCDHRVVDGVLGAQLLAAVVDLLQKPLAMVLNG